MDRCIFLLGLFILFACQLIVLIVEQVHRGLDNNDFLIIMFPLGTLLQLPSDERRQLSIAVQNRGNNCKP